ncbi:MAG: nucleotidyltransferase substrate binding protein [Bdellovibrionota bacterium]
MGTNATAPKTIIREMAQASLIDDPNLWFQFLEARNLSSHTYNEELAERVYAEAKNFLSYGQKLAKKLIDF